MCGIYLFRHVDLSYNDIPFITKKMFPENKWIPYRLEVISLWVTRWNFIFMKIYLGLNKSRGRFLNLQMGYLQKKMWLIAHPHSA